MASVNSLFADITAGEFKRSNCNLAALAQPSELPELTFLCLLLVVG